MESNSGIWGRIPLPYSTLPEGMKFTLVVFSCKRYVDIVTASASHQVGTRTRAYTVYNIALEPGTGTGLREIDVHRQRSSVLVSRSKTVLKRQCLVGVQARTSIAKYY